MIMNTHIIRHNYISKARRYDALHTPLYIIEEEMQHYVGCFKNKTVYCNCDSENSAFYVYFHKHFNELGLKRLIVSGYERDEINIRLVYDGGCDNDLKKCDMELLNLSAEDTGDYKCLKSCEILRASDIVVTCPPFSTWSAYLDFLISYNKKFVLLGKRDALFYKNVMLYVVEKQLGIGCTCRDGRRALFTDIAGRPQDYLSCRWYQNIELDNGARRIIAK